MKRRRQTFYYREVELRAGMIMMGACILGFIQWHHHGLFYNQRLLALMRLTLSD
jgi:hypothetical protein